MNFTGTDEPHHHHEDELKFSENLGATAAASLLDYTVDLSVLQNKTDNGGFGSLDWPCLTLLLDRQWRTYWTLTSFHSLSSPLKNASPFSFSFPILFISYNVVTLKKSRDNLKSEKPK